MDRIPRFSDKPNSGTQYHKINAVVYLGRTYVDLSERYGANAERATLAYNQMATAAADLSPEDYDTAATKVAEYWDSLRTDRTTKTTTRD